MINRFFLNWTKKNVETAQEKVKLLLKRPTEQKDLQIVTDNEFEDLLNHLNFHVINKKKIKKGKLTAIELPIFDKNLHQGGLISKISCCVLNKEQAEIYFKDFNYDDIQYFDFYHVVWLLKCLHQYRYDFPNLAYAYIDMKGAFLKFFVEIVERSLSINLDILELFKSFIIDNLNRLFTSEEKIELLCLLLKINEEETLDYLDEYNKDLKLFEKKEIEKAKETVRINKVLNKKIKPNSKNSTKKKYVKKISEETGLWPSEIKLLVEEKKNEYNIKISDKAIFYLIIMELAKSKKNAPQCRGFKKEGTECQNSVRHPSGYCHHHR